MQESQVELAAVKPEPAAEQAPCCASDPERSRKRRWLIGGGVLAVGAAAVYGGWGWIVASGTGVVLLGLAPCLAMCALGLCMGGRKKT